jgi:hypothetical protein
MVSNWRSAAGMTAIWVFAVAGVSATAWIAIDRAGRDISTAAVSATPAPALNTPAMRAEPIPASAKPKTRPTVKPAATPTPSAVASPVATPAPTPQPRHTRDRSGGAPTPAAVSAPQATPTSQDNTISVTGGLVSARCTGTAIKLLIAQPENDWRYRVDTSNGAQIVVSFQRGEEDSTTSTVVTGVCANGAPQFSVSGQ